MARTAVFKKKWLAEKSIRQLATLIYFNQIRHPEVVDLSEEDLWTVFQGGEIFQLSLIDSGRWIKPYFSALSSLEDISDRVRFRGVLEQFRLKWAHVDPGDDPLLISKVIADTIDSLDKQK